MRPGEHPSGKPERERLRIETRFWRKVDWGSEDECWEWQAATFRTGYGAFHSGGAARAHRVAYELENGEIPGGEQINHECDNRSCVNPRHLYPGTQQENIRDAIERNRKPGQLPPETVREIREKYENKDINQEELADEYETSQSAISRITSDQAYDFIE